MKWEIETIINTAIALKRSGRSAASTGERIAAAFVLNDMSLLPPMYSNVVEAWNRLEPEWQRYVQTIQRHHMNRIEEA